MTALIPLIGIGVFALIIYLTLELAPAAPTGRLAETLTPADGVVLSGWRRSLSMLDKPVSKWTPAGFVRKARADLYWAQTGREVDGLERSSIYIAAYCCWFGRCRGGNRGLRRTHFGASCWNDRFSIPSHGHGRHRPAHAPAIHRPAA